MVSMSCNVLVRTAHPFVSACTHHLQRSLVLNLGVLRGSRRPTAAAAVVAAGGAAASAREHPVRRESLLVHLEDLARARPVLRALAGRVRRGHTRRPPWELAVLDLTGSRAHDGGAQSQPRICKGADGWMGGSVAGLGRGLRRGPGWTGRKGWTTDSCRMRECWLSRSYSACRITCDSWICCWTGERTHEYEAR